MRVYLSSAELAMVRDALEFAIRQGPVIEARHPMVRCGDREFRTLYRRFNEIAPAPQQQGAAANQARKDAGAGCSNSAPAGNPVVQAA